jgi:hypothetical protein
VTVDAASVTAALPPLRTGDVSDNNVINISDFSLLAASFGLASGAPGFDPRADLNGDGVVNLTDYTLLAGNFGTAGAPDPSAPQGFAAVEAAADARETARLRVTPGTARVGGTVRVTVRVDRTGRAIDGAAVRLAFDPARFAVEAVTAGRLFDRTLLLTWDNAAGTVDAAVGSLSGRVGGQIDLVTVQLRVLSAGETTIALTDGLLTAAGAGTPLRGSVTVRAR